ncbi:MAG: hypothetical protein IPL75_23885 [Acidobacteria bacterium]|nr:hypothetical protein [Acidobacteriota bacterium]
MLAPTRTSSTQRPYAVVPHRQLEPELRRAHPEDAAEGRRARRHRAARHHLGKGFEWETTLFDVTPVSGAQFGLLPQVHRRDTDIYDNIRLLLEAGGRAVPPLDNVPNAHLTPKQS